MGISAIEAGRIANAHGLSLSDAVALQKLSNDTAEAEAFAAQFTGKAQLTRADLEGKSADQINAFRENGQLADLMDGK
jgi:hypothetical protein